MKIGILMVATTAALALAGCGQDKGSSGTAANETVTITQAKPPPGGDWTDVVNATSAGYLMGNPDAKVKLVEIASLSCPYCKRFEDEGVPKILEQVKGGQLSWEFRPYLIHGAVDMAANLLARCNGVKTFFPLAKAFYNDQAKFAAKIESTPQDQLEKIQNLPPEQVFLAMANLLGMPEWAAARGVPTAKGNQCLTDRAMIDHEVQVTSDVTSQYPDFKGTPSFIINGKLLADTGNWAKLEPQLKEALQ